MLARAWLRSVERDLFPWLGSSSVEAITAPSLLAVLGKVEDRGAVRSAHDLLASR